MTMDFESFTLGISKWHAGIVNSVGHAWPDILYKEKKILKKKKKKRKKKMRTGC
jgi:hypothetical protein